MTRWCESLHEPRRSRYLDQTIAAWRASRVLVGGIANILHRDTIAVIVGNKTFERGEQCYNAGRVVKVEATRGELRGSVRPQERARAPYAIRLWIREDGLAYECTCPIGETRQFCKHTVAVALAHLENERAAAELEIAKLRVRLATMSPHVLADKLLALARTDGAVLEALKRLVPGE